MPAQKRSLQDTHSNDDQDALLQHTHHAKQHLQEDETVGNQLTLKLKEERMYATRGGGGGGGDDEGEEEEDDDDDDYDDEEEDDDSEATPSSTSQQKPEFVLVELPEIRKDVQCPICLGIIKKTRTVMECLHRFCRECIDKSMRLGNNECPACRTHCASRRSLRDDPNYDALIAALYPDIDKYEEEELAFHEEERTRNKQIQASIAQIFQRQYEALVKRRSVGKDMGMTRLHRNPRSAHSRRRRNSRGIELQVSEDNGDENEDNGGKDSSSTDERSTEVRQRRRRRRSGIWSSQPSSSAANSDGGCIENDLDVGRDSRGISPGPVWSAEMLAWGRGGARSNTRHGSASSCNNKSLRSARLNRLVEYLRGLQENNDELDVHLMLVSLDNQSTPSLEQPYLCCRPSLSVKKLCEYVSLQTPLRAEEVEMLMVKEHLDTNENLPALNPSTDKLQILEGQETLAGLRVNCASSRDHLILAYRRKQE